MVNPKKNKGKIIVRHKKIYFSEEEVFSFSYSGFLKLLHNRRNDAYTKQNFFGSEIILDGIRYFFTNRKAKKQRKNLFMFSMVKRNVRTYLKSHYVAPLDWTPSIHWRKKLVVRPHKVVGIDLDAAYWTIAHKLGIISQRTYERGIEIDDKRLILVTLSCLGTDKRYSKIESGMFTNDILLIKGDNQMRDVYQLIRYTCFKYMRQLAKHLGNDYICYKTDCIFFFDADGSNFAMASDFLKRHNLEFKWGYANYDRLELKKYMESPRFFEVGQ